MGNDFPCELCAQTSGDISRYHVYEPSFDVGTLLAKLFTSMFPAFIKVHNYFDYLYTQWRS